MYMLGVVFFQCIIEGGFLIFSLAADAWESYEAGDFDDVDEYLDFTNVIFRHGDLILVMDVFGLDENDKIAMRDCGVAACRFLAEDISQTIIQFLFLMEDHGSNESRELVIFSIVIAITLSSIKFLGGVWKCYKNWNN